jgi:hypothetical protein
MGAPLPWLTEKYTACVVLIIVGKEGSEVPRHVVVLEVGARCGCIQCNVLLRLVNQEADDCVKISC